MCCWRQSKQAAVFSLLLCNKHPFSLPSQNQSQRVDNCDKSTLLPGLAGRSVCKLSTKTPTICEWIVLAAISQLPSLCARFFPPASSSSGNSAVQSNLPPHFFQPLLRQWVDGSVGGGGVGGGVCEETEERRVGETLTETHLSRSLVHHLQFCHHQCASTFQKV